MSVKKTFSVIIICICVLFSCRVSAFNALATALNTQKVTALTTGINAVGVYDITSGQTLYTKNASSKISIASTTKLLTSLVALNYVSPDRVFSVGSEINLIKPNSSVCGLSYGHSLKLRTLIAGMLLPSGNDAAYTVAVNVARIQSGKADMSDTQAVEYFCSLMNEYAKELGCKNSHFVNPEGWDNSNHYSTVEDMALIARAAVGNAIITSVACISSQNFTFASGHHITWKNTNSLLDPDSKYYYPNAKGLKTGTTSSAGKCLVTYSEQNGHKLLVLVYGANTEDDRFDSTAQILKLLTFTSETGDVNGDGRLTAADARLVLRASVGLEELTAELLKMGDTDSDGKLTATDARSILRASVGLEVLGM